MREREKRERDRERERSLSAIPRKNTGSNPSIDPSAPAVDVRRKIALKEGATPVFLFSLLLIFYLYVLFDFGEN